MFEGEKNPLPQDSADKFPDVSEGSQPPVSNEPPDVPRAQESDVEAPRIPEVDQTTGESPEPPNSPKSPDASPSDTSPGEGDKANADPAEVDEAEAIKLVPEKLEDVSTEVLLDLGDKMVGLNTGYIGGGNALENVDSLIKELNKRQTLLNPETKQILTIAHIDELITQLQNIRYLAELSIEVQRCIDNGQSQSEIETQLLGPEEDEETDVLVSNKKTKKSRRVRELLAAMAPDMLHALSQSDFAPLLSVLLGIGLGGEGGYGHGGLRKHLEAPQGRSEEVNESTFIEVFKERRLLVSQVFLQSVSNTERGLGAAGWKMADTLRDQLKTEIDAEKPAISDENYRLFLDMIIKNLFDGEEADRAHKWQAFTTLVPLGIYGNETQKFFGTEVYDYLERQYKIEPTKRWAGIIEQTSTISPDSTDPPGVSSGQPIPFPKASSPELAKAA